ncbi:MAG: hypothetical protein IJU44_06430 [Kiritimatiellae bacterium]|nr:hypothetical protein [Kiritimatiellia bacterium]
MHNHHAIYPICTALLLAAGCAAILLPHTVECRKNSGKDWASYEAVSIDRIPGFTPKPDPSPDEYGGWLGTNVGNPDGYFRVRKIDGRWWMVDPTGNLFLAKSVASFSPGMSARQKAACKEKFGGVTGWAASEIRFLKSCGFNSLGAWAVSEAFGTPAQQERIPYTVIVSPMAKYNRELKQSGREADYFKDVKEGGSSFGFPFVFDPEFEQTAERVIAPVAKHASDPWLVGYFIDNEVQFQRSMLWKCLTAWPKDHPNRRAAQKWLDTRKGRVGCTMRDVTEEDRLDFVAHCIDIYLSTVARILRKYDANHMFLGSRFHLWNTEMRNPACFKVAGKYLDVISINHYNHWQPDQTDMRNWEAWSGKPFMVTEFYVKGEDSGLPNTTGAGWLVHTQDERGIFYQNFVNELLKSGVCVGWHWFKYGDNDPENLSADPSNRDSNKGIVTWDFRRYEPLVERMKAINGCTYGLARFHERGN